MPNQLHGTIATELDTLRLVLKSKNETIDGLCAELTTKRAELEKCRAVLADVEWKGEGDYFPEEPEARCPECGNQRREGHASKCALEAAKGTK